MMTNKEKYKQAFSVLQTSEDFCLEVTKMDKPNIHRPLRALAASFAACILIFASATTVYAADIGGIQRIIQVWIHGEQTDASITFDGNGNYEMEFTDSEGKVHHRGGGGMGFDAFGRERPMTEAELMEQMAMPVVEYAEDDSVWIYWYDQKIEITDKFENGVCYVKLVHGEKTEYLTIKYKGGFMSSPHKYVKPEQFSIGK